MDSPAQQVVVGFRSRIIRIISASPTQARRGSVPSALEWATRTAQQRRQRRGGISTPAHSRHAHARTHTDTRAHGHTRTHGRVHAHSPPRCPFLPRAGPRRAPAGGQGGPCPWRRGNGEGRAAPRRGRGAGGSSSPRAPGMGEPVSPPASRLLPPRSARGPSPWSEVPRRLGAPGTTFGARFPGARPVASGRTAPRWRPSSRRRRGSRELGEGGAGRGRGRGRGFPALVRRAAGRRRGPADTGLHRGRGARRGEAPPRGLQVESRGLGWGRRGFRGRLGVA